MQTFSLKFIEGVKVLLWNWSILGHSKEFRENKKYVSQLDIFKKIISSHQFWKNNHDKIYLHYSFGRKSGILNYFNKNFIQTCQSKSIIDYWTSIVEWPNQYSPNINKIFIYSNKICYQIWNLKNNDCKNMNYLEYKHTHEDYSNLNIGFLLIDINIILLLIIILSLTQFIFQKLFINEISGLLIWKC